jgi:hypothetical protein
MPPIARLLDACELRVSSLDSLQSSSSIPSCAGTSPRLHSAHQLLSNSRRPGRDDPLILDRLLGRQGFSFFLVFLSLFIYLFIYFSTLPATTWIG